MSSAFFFASVPILNDALAEICSQSMGQNCIGVERFLVHSSLYEEFMAEMSERVRKLRLGSVLSSSAEGFVSVVDGGSMINDTQFGELQRLITAAESQGASMVCGGTPWRNPYLENGAYFHPTLLGNVNEQMEIAQREGPCLILVCPALVFMKALRPVFGPIMLVMKYDTVDEAIQIANGLRYGLGASIFGPDHRQCREIAMSLECGMVSINDFGVYYVRYYPPLAANDSNPTSSL